jgi:hypothetical protein
MEAFNIGASIDGHALPIDSSGGKQAGLAGVLTQAASLRGGRVAIILWGANLTDEHIAGSLAGCSARTDRSRPGFIDVRSLPTSPACRR